MSKDFQINEPEKKQLSKSLFIPKFKDENLEMLWMEERLKSFKKTNKRALWFLLFSCLLFFPIDLIIVQSDNLIHRALFIIFTAICIVSIRKVQTIKQGDSILLLVGSGAIAYLWFFIFLQLPNKLIADYWIVTTSLLVVSIFVLIETMLLTRLIFGLILMSISIAAPVYLQHDLTDILLSMTHLILILIVGWVAAWQVEIAKRDSFIQMILVKEERSQTIGLLRKILPSSIADRLLNEPGIIADRHPEVVVLFADIVGFTPWAANSSATTIVAVLDQVFSSFDTLCDKNGVEKIKTIGDAYMAAGGVPEGNKGDVNNVVTLAVEMMKIVSELSETLESRLELRIGIHQGPVIAGVIGRRKFIYDLWGDTVNTASRMESHGIPGKIQVTQIIAEQLAQQFSIEPRGQIEIKGKGAMSTFFVTL